MKVSTLTAKIILPLLSLVGLVIIFHWHFIGNDGDQAWDQQQLSLLRSLALPANMSVLNNETLTNRYAGNEAAERFGHKLFFDVDLSMNRDLACASCHQPDKFFTDGQRFPLSNDKPILRNTPSIVGAGLSAWQFWDGRRDSLWAQSLDVLESTNEHAIPRTMLAARIAVKYRTEYEAVFGPLPDLSDTAMFPLMASPAIDIQKSKMLWARMSDENKFLINIVFTNVGKAIGAYEAKLMPATSKFDEYVASLNNAGQPPQGEPPLLSAKEIAGLKLFIDDSKGQCIRCHNGPMFTNSDFKAINVPPSRHTDQGRKHGVVRLLNEEFNCKSRFSDAGSEHCEELAYVKTDGFELDGAFKVPTLRNLQYTAPYMHTGVFNTLDEVLHYYNRPAIEDGVHIDIEALRLLPYKLEQLKAFLMTLNGGIAADDEWLQPPQKKGDVRNYLASLGRTQSQVKIQ